MHLLEGLNYCLKDRSYTSGGGGSYGAQRDPQNELHVSGHESSVLELVADSGCCRPSRPTVRPIHNVQFVS